MSISRYLSLFTRFLTNNGIVTYQGGGTGLSATPANGQIDIGNGSGFTRANISAGTGINVTNGAGTIEIASTIIQPQVKAQLFNSSGTWTAPTGVTSVRVWCIGGGGGSYYNNCSNGAGGAGGYAVGIYTVSPGTGYTVTIGSGGTGSTTGAGSSGGTSSFGSFISATGGSGGPFGSGQGNSGSGSGGTILNSNAASTYYVIYQSPVGTGSQLKTSGTAPATGANGTYGAGNGSVASFGGIGGMVYLEWVG